ncbi:uncharacterized protein LOC110831793 [Zootermopsis nevadensis]|uniref:Uncharacterized protein n=1 Tax=Zootermopsis nevadensis TaxID=136037 RepID=A0A067R577_ZOONE|nr:uncharacterized protein LOC110831793 [Zootermopsis nevadensis]KDR17345.1 hypothetical protein L798_08545 [Zootermopsis nevadensis]
MDFPKAVLLLLVNAVLHSGAQQCLSRPCGKLACLDACAISSQEDCVGAGAEEYLYPGLVCECCGACVIRSVEKGGPCSTRILDSHVAGCARGLCCSTEGICVEKTTTFGA